MKKTYTREEIVAVANKYTSKIAFLNSDKNYYQAAKRRGILDEICKHMEDNSARKPWTKEEILDLMSKFETPTAFRNAHPGAYIATKRLKIPWPENYRVQSNKIVQSTKKLKAEELGITSKIDELISQGLSAMDIVRNLNVGRHVVYGYLEKTGKKAADGRILLAASKKEQFPCVICNKLFHGRRSRYESGSLKTCSKTCSNNLKSISSPRYAKIEKECIVCKKKFLVKPSRANTSTCCSKKCFSMSSSIAFTNPGLLETYKKMLAEGKTLEEIGNAVGKSAHSVSQVMSVYNIGHPYNRGSKSAQERDVLKMLGEVLGEEIGQAGRYPNSSYVYDGLCSLGYIEYDGRGGHYRPDQITRDLEKDKLLLDKPIIRLSPQAFYGKHDYLKHKLLSKNEGYVSGSNEYKVLKASGNDVMIARQMLRDCHPLGTGVGTILFVLKYRDMVIGVSQWGMPTDKNESGTELRRFFVLDGTPKNTESKFLGQCLTALRFEGCEKLITYCHEWEKASYLLATGWTEVERKHREYDFYHWNGKVFSKRIWWKWAKEAGLVDLLGSAEAKKQLAEYLGATVIYEGTKRKFVKDL